MDEMISIVDKVSVQPIPPNQVLRFTETADPERLEDVAIWSKAGINIPNTTTPFEAFSEQLDLAFTALTRTDQETLLRDSFRMVFGDFQERAAVKMTPYIDPWSRRRYNYRDQFVLFSGGVLNRSGITYTKNVATYLEKALEMTSGDLEATKAFLLTVPPIRYPDTQRSLANSLSLLYGSRELDDINQKEALRFRKLAGDIRDRFQASDPKARALAFWADTKFGTFNFNGKNADIQTREILAENDPALKTEVLKYIKEELLTDEPGYTHKHALIERAIGDQRALYLALKDKLPDSPFVQNYEMIQRMLKLRRMESRLRGDTITPKDLTILLTFYPTLITQISDAELRNAIDSSEDPNIAKALSDIIQRKEALRKLSGSNQLDEPSK